MLGMGCTAKLCLSLSYLLGCGFLLAYPMCRIFWVFFRGNCSSEEMYIAVDSVYPSQEVSSVFSCVVILYCTPSAFLNMPLLPDPNTWNIHATYFPQLSSHFFLSAFPRLLSDPSFFNSVLTDFNKLL